MAFPAATSTVSTLAALTALLATWDADWSGTASSLGISTGASRYVDLDDGSYGQLDLADLVFPEMVYVRGATKTTPSARVTGLEISDCTNITIQFFKTDRTGTGHGGQTIYFRDTTTFCGAEYCYFLGDPEATATTGGYGVRMESACSDCFLRECVFESWRVGVYNNFADRFEITKCLFRRMAGDDMKLAGQVDAVIDRNWFSRVKVKYASGDHVDNVQHQQGTGANGVDLIGNVIMKGDASVGKSVQGLFFDDGPMYDVIFTNNIVMTNTGGVKMGSDVTSGSGNNSTKNTCLYPADDSQSNIFTCGSSVRFGTSSLNVVTAPDGGDGGAGTGGITIEVGPNKDNRDYSDYPTYFTGDVDNDSAFGDLVPKTGSGMHWNDADYAGAAERFEEVVVDGVHPGNSDNATLASLWQSDYNADDAITSDASGGGGDGPTGFVALSGGLPMLSAGGLPMLTG